MSNTNAQKYPWDRWFSLKYRKKLERGKDYHCKDHGMASQIRNRAREYGVSVSVEIGDGWIIFKVG